VNETLLANQELPVNQEFTSVTVVTSTGAVGIIVDGKTQRLVSGMTYKQYKPAMGFRIKDLSGSTNVVELSIGYGSEILLPPSSDIATETKLGSLLTAISNLAEVTETQPTSDAGQSFTGKAGFKIDVADATTKISICGTPVTATNGQMVTDLILHAGTACEVTIKDASDNILNYFKMPADLPVPLVSRGQMCGAANEKLFLQTDVASQLDGYVVTAETTPDF